MQTKGTNNDFRKHLERCFFIPFFIALKSMEQFISLISKQLIAH